VTQSRKPGGEKTTNRKRQVCIITGSRSDWGYLAPIASEVGKRKGMEFQLICTGSHLSPTFGLTKRDVIRDGFDFAGEVEVILASDTHASLAYSVGLGVISFVKELQHLAPDMVLVFGDRYEILSASLAALFLRIPLAHYAGGDRAAGTNVDDTIRDLISRIAHVHFTIHPAHSRRLISLGEQPDRIHCVGSTLIDEVRIRRLPSRREIIRRLGLGKDEGYVLFLENPITMGDERVIEGYSRDLESLRGLGHDTVVIAPNADLYSQFMVRLLDRYSGMEGFRVYKSVNHTMYLGLLKHANVLVGNTSSGIFEASYFGVPFVSIGHRQERLVVTENTFVVERGRALTGTIERLYHDDSVRERLKSSHYPFGDRRSSPAARIVDVLARLQLAGDYLNKFQDIEEARKRLAL